MMRIIGSILVLAACLQPASALQTKSFDQHAPITASPIPLNPENLEQNTVGKLQYVAGWELASTHSQFGGISALLVNGQRVAAISDNSMWWQADFNSENKTNPFPNSTLTWQKPLLSAEDSTHIDAEALVRLPYGYLISFERNHRFEQVWFPGGWMVHSDLGSAIDFTGIPANGGIEAMTWVQGDKLIAFQEKGKNHKGLLKAWILDGKSAEILWFKPPQNFAVTDATTLPDGDIVLLLRSFSPLNGTAIKLVRIAAESIKEDAVLEGEELGTLKAPINVDNMEGLDSTVLPDGTIRLYMISDNNFQKSIQRTLFMIFDVIQ